MKMFKYLLPALLLVTQAHGGAEGTGGGDPCENRIKVIAQDIKSWIQKGGAKGLVLPQNITISAYSNFMIAEINKAQVICVDENDSSYPIKVDGVPKVCRFDQIGNKSKVTCDIRRFQALSEEEQYVLIHHEYAGLAGIEKPKGAKSEYESSNQITIYLENQIVKKLAIHPTSAKPNITNNFGKFLDSLHNKAYVAIAVNLNPKYKGPQIPSDEPVFHIQRGWENEIVLTRLQPQPTFYSAPFADRFKNFPMSMSMVCIGAEKKCIYSEILTTEIPVGTANPNDPKCKGNWITYAGPVAYKFEINMLPSGDFYIGRNTSETLLNQAPQAYSPSGCRPEKFVREYGAMEYVELKIKKEEK